MTFGYNAKAIFSQSVADIEDFARILLSNLKVRREEDVSDYQQLHPDLIMNYSWSAFAKMSKISFLELLSEVIRTCDYRDRINTGGDAFLFESS